MINQSRVEVPALNKNILVTGAAGFIGSFLCEELVANGYFVLGIDNFFRGKLANIQPLKTNASFIFEEIDLSLAKNVNQIKDLLIKHQINTLFHLAAINGTQYFYDRSFFVLDQNIKMTQNLLTSIQETQVKYLIYTSSSEVYGEALQYPTNETHPILLNIDADRDSYAISKATSEFYCRLFAKQHHLEYLILRIFNLYGERMDCSGYGQVIPEFIYRLLYEKKFTILGEGSNTRSFCYIKEAVFAMRKLMERQILGVINLGNDQEITILQLAKMIHDLEKTNFNPIFLPGRSNDHQRRCPDIHYLKSLLPELKFTPLMQGLKQVIDFYKKIKN